MIVPKQYAYFSSEVYKAGGGVAPMGWEIYATSDSLGVSYQSGYYAAAYRNITTNEIVIAHRGTQFSESADVQSLLSVAYGKRPAQYADAQDFYARVNTQARVDNLTNAVFSHTGHSLGGALANLMAVYNAGETAVGFNSLGVADLVPVGSYSNITNISSVFDLAKSVGTRIGTIKNVFVSSYAGVPDALEPLVSAAIANFAAPLGFIAFGQFLSSQHSIANLLSTLSALPDDFSGIPETSVELDYSSDGSVSGAWENEWQDLANTLSADNDLDEAFDNFYLPDEGVLGVAGIAAEQDTNLATPRQYAGTSLNNLVVGENGPDTLTGAGGNDFIFGDAGSDVLQGEAGRDILVGGDGDDSLRGGGGHDILLGGEGLDIYEFFSSDGLDTIQDSDGQGQLRIGGIILAGGEQIAAGAWKNEMQNVSYTFQPGANGRGTLAIISDAVTVQVENFSPGELGIALQSAQPAPTPAGDDTRVGTEANDYLNALAAGNNILIGLAGNDLLESGDGSDWLQGSDGSDYLHSGTDQQGDTIEGGTGDDGITGGEGDDYLYAERREDLIAFQSGTATQTAGSTRDVLGGNGGEDVIVGGAGADLIAGGIGADVIYGGAGDDVIAGAGELYYREAIPPQRDYTRPDFGAWNSPHDDLLIRLDASYEAQDAGDVILAGAGNDDVRASFGDDFIFGELGNDTLEGAEGSDYLQGDSGDDILLGDSLTAEASQHGSDYVDGGDGNDIVVGHGGNDDLFGGIGDDELQGGTGDDFLDGEDGADRLFGQEGADSLLGGAGADELVGNEGDDFLSGEGDNDRLFGEAGADILEGNAGDDQLQGGADNDVLSGGDGADVLFGEAGNDTLSGDFGNDELQGGDGNDTLAGGDGVDQLYGDAGDDRLDGGAGADYLEGNAGNDRFIVGAGDTIDDSQGANTIELTQFNAVSDVVLGAGFSTSNLVLTDVNGGGSATVVSGLLGGVQSYQFANGANFTLEELLNTAQANNFNISADHDNNVILGGRGNDLISGLGGDDSLRGGSGNDDLQGGLGNDTLEGGEGDDRLLGYEPSSFDAGNDTLDGGRGNDRLFGGEGSATYVYDRGDGADEIGETPSQTGQGFDVLRLGTGILPEHVSLYRTDDGVGFEDLIIVLDNGPAQLVLTNYFADIAQYGDYRVEQIVFDNGNGPTWTYDDVTARVLSGTPNSQTGTAGDDSFTVDHRQDLVTEAANAGIDTILSSVSYALPANVENLTLTGVLNINATGNQLNNVLRGNIGNNVLDARNPVYVNDNDTLIGGAGDDAYHVSRNNGTTTIIENAGEGADTVYAPDGYILPGNVENLVGNNQVHPLSSNLLWRGNALNNVITVTSQFHGDIIDGGGGADTVTGNGASFKFIVDNAGDRIFAAPLTPGRDLVESSVDFTLGTYLEDLTLTGSNPISGTGNSSDNILTGSNNSAVNVLTGGLGNDTYVIDNTDIVVESANGGVSDTVEIVTGAAGSYNLASFSNVENLKLGAALNQSDSIGNDLNNRLEGNPSNNSLFGAGGDDALVGNQGNDQLYGGTGNDVLDGGKDSDFLDGGTGADTLSGGEDWDMYVVDDVADIVYEYPTSFGYYGGIDTVRSSVSYTLSDHVEDLILTGDFAISGSGNNQSNTLDGSQSDAANVLTGGGGDDLYIVDAGDSVVENPGKGTDTVSAGFSYTLGANLENLTLTGSFGASGTGNALGNTLDGSQNTAANVLSGLTGDDTYVVDSADVVIENVNEGSDLVIAKANYSLGQNIENLTLAEVGAINGTGNELNNVLTGNYSDNVLDGGTGSDVLYGLGGADTYIINDASDVIIEEPFAFGSDTVVSSFNYALGSDLENLILSGSAPISATGNELDNTLDGSQNNASNVLSGGAGNDIYIVDSLDTIFENAGEGVDIVNAALGYVLGANVENLALTGTNAINGTGNSLVNTISGNSAANVLDGGAGNDTLKGGLGDDTYIFGTGDTITELANEGNDTVQSSVTYTLGANLENLTLTGSAVINGTGNTLANVLTGNSAANVLAGGAGNDSYYVGPGDTVTENSGQGTDTVLSGVSWTLGANVENLTLTGTAAINGTGNTLANVLTGNSAENTLDGGAGADTLRGGLGDDSYIFGTGDTIVENLNEGTDTVNSSVTHTLVANVENLTLTGTSAINGTGNGLNNILTGNSAKNTLSGKAGDDIYIIAGTDVVSEVANEGIDLVKIGSTYTLGSSVEALNLIGASAINGTGNTLNNLLIGNSAVNTLNGSGGNDLLQGLAGNDTLSDSSGKNLFDGGAGADTLTGGTGNELFIGGVGNDTITTGAGADMIGFNRGDGTDTVNASTGADNTISLGGGINYSDLSFSKSGNNLILNTASAESITFKDWYASTANRSVVTLQMVAEAMSDFDAAGSDPLKDDKIENFDFSGLVQRFDQGGIVSNWSLTDALLDFHLSGSDTDALGGDLAYQYGKNNTLAGIGFTAAQNVIGSTQFGTAPQTLQPLASLQEGVVKLA